MVRFCTMERCRWYRDPSRYGKVCWYGPQCWRGYLDLILLAIRLRGRGP